MPPPHKFSAKILLVLLFLLGNFISCKKDDLISVTSFDKKTTKNARVQDHVYLYTLGNVDQNQYQCIKCLSISIIGGVPAPNLTLQRSPNASSWTDVASVISSNSATLCDRPGLAGLPQNSNVYYRYKMVNPNTGEVSFTSIKVGIVGFCRKDL